MAEFDNDAFATKRYVHYLATVDHTTRRVTSSMACFWHITSVYPIKQPTRLLIVPIMVQTFHGTLQ